MKKYIIEYKMNDSNEIVTIPYCVDNNITTQQVFEDFCKHHNINDKSYFYIRSVEVK